MSSPSPLAASEPTAASLRTGWQFWIDRGGTFTDIVAVTPEGALTTAKLLSENPAHYADAAIEGIRRLMQVAPGAALPVHAIAGVKMGTTVATNALLERKGEATVLAITRGFGDLLRIGYQNRPRLFDRAIVLPELLHRHVIEIDERIAADGTVVASLDETAAQKAFAHAISQGYRSIAIVLMHGYRFHAHEEVLARLAHEAGFTQVSVSHQVSPLIKIVSRGDTTVVDAYLSPVLQRYVRQVADALPGVPIHFMQSNGGLTSAAQFRGKDAVLSGPAGGIVGMTATACAAGFQHVIGFDMGGTSTDVSHYAGQLEREYDTAVAGVRLRAPMLAIHTIAAGGGSILHFDGARFRVGPESAGANPGPASYGKGGPLTVTDCNVMVGNLLPAHFPKVFGASGHAALDAEAVCEKFTALAEDISRATRQPHTAESVAEGFLAVAVTNMANAIRKISVERGHDVAQYTLQCFGGAGGQHACLVASVLGMRTILIHPFAGVLSAYGMGLADIVAMRECSVEETLDAHALARLEGVRQRLIDEATAEVAAQDIPPSRIRHTSRLHIKYHGTDSALGVELAAIGEMVQSFETQYRQRFGFLMQARALVIDSMSVEVVGMSDAAEHVVVAASPGSASPDTPLSTTGIKTTQIWRGGAWHEARVLHRREMKYEEHEEHGQPSTSINGPAIINDESATTVVEPGWRADMRATGELVLTCMTADTSHKMSSATLTTTTAPDPVRLEVFASLFMAIAEQMGTRLQQTAYSVNIKERLDFSCAIFDGQGNLIANAPHMPVHLGSMGESVSSVVTRNRHTMQRGDSYVLNDPFHGGTHLPDITVVTPVWVNESSAGKDKPDTPDFFVASRGHHADVGGITPGSMPPFSRTMHEEGVLIDNVKLVEHGTFLEQEIKTLLGLGAHPARNIAQNLADLRAQVAANAKGAEELARMAAMHGIATVKTYMQHVQDNAEQSVRHAIRALPFEGPQRVRVTMDNGATIAVAVEIGADRESATIDFTGTSTELTSNFNAPSAVVTAAVLYVFRLLVASDIPLNAGCLKPLKIVIPEGSMLNPRPPAATVAGNVETSQAITDALVRALGLMAASSGTMNNFTFGNDTHQYYETVSGGAAAGPGFAGCDAVQVHMTNSRMTDPEVLELRFPVRVEEHAIRRGSGGGGRWRGGDGAIRRIRFLEAMTAAILAGNRIHAPLGMSGGGDALPGLNWVARTDGTRHMLSYADEAPVDIGDVFVLETPGGGGWGRAG